MRFPAGESVGRCRLLPCLLAAALMSLGGCRVGPEYRRPCVPVQTHWSQAGHSRLQGETTNLCYWWQHFHDPLLSSLIEEAACQNLTLREAGQRVLEARARRDVAIGNRYPQLQTATGSYSKGRLSENTANFFSASGVFIPDLTPENWSLGAQLAWELDFWGRYRRAIEAADARLEATIAAHDEARVLLLAEVARTYVEMRTLEHRIELAKKNMQVQLKTLNLAKKKEEAGIGTVIDTSQAEVNLRRTEATLPSLEILRRQASHRLAVLLGAQPVEVEQAIRWTGHIPRPPEQLAFGIPADLLRRRPDIRRVERELAAQSAKIGIAESELYPHISLNGNIGVSAEDMGNLFNSGSQVGLISPQFTWNLLNYGRIKSNVRAEQAAFGAICNQYRQTVLDAAREAEDAQVAYVYGFDRVASLQASVAAAEVAVEKSDALYKSGAVDYNRVYIVQSDLLRQQDELAVAESDISLSLIALFKALGGGWGQCCAEPVQPMAVPMTVVQANLFAPPSARDANLSK